MFFRKIFSSTRPAEGGAHRREPKAKPSSPRETPGVSFGSPGVEELANEAIIGKRHKEVTMPVNRVIQSAKPQKVKWGETLEKKLARLIAGEPKPGEAEEAEPEQKEEEK